jgi:transcriptional regulator GlxA family with amidase domain
MWFAMIATPLWAVSILGRGWPIPRGPFPPSIPQNAPRPDPTAVEQRSNGHVCHDLGHNGSVAEAGARSQVVVMVVFDDVTMLDVAGAGEVFAEANRFGADYRLKIASVDGRDVATSIGTRLGVTDAISSIDGADTVMIAGSDQLPQRLIDPALVEAVKSLAGRTRRLASICTGSFILAQSGLLDGKRATTHWHETRRLARAFPGVTVEPDALFVRDGDVFTSAGISSGIDLALALVEMDHGAELVRDVARWLVVYLKRAGGQSQFSVLVEAEPPPESPLRRVTDAISANPGADHSVKKLAAQAALSARQLTRLFQSELHTTPARYVEAVRIDFARGSLEAGRNVAETARIAGFGSAETLRRVFLNQLGITPKAYRDRFRSTYA